MEQNIRFGRRTVRFFHSVAFSPDGKVLAYGMNNCIVKIMEIGQEKAVTSIGEISSGYVTSVAFSPDGKILASGLDDGSIRLTSLKTKKTISTLKKNSDSVISLAFSPDGKILASGDKTGTVKLWDIHTNKESKAFTTHSCVSSLAFSPDGKTLASGSNLYDGIKIWDVVTQEKLVNLDGYLYRNNLARNDSLAFSPDGKILASASKSNIVKLWKLATGEEIVNLIGDLIEVRAVLFISNKKILLFGNDDESMKVWDVEFPSL